jgi:gluconokinase
LRLAHISAEQLSPLADWDEPCHTLSPKFARRWPELADTPWYLPVGDGALANVGAGAVTPQWACATIGTSSALRVILTTDRLEIPWGSFAYRLDRKRFVVGGALSEGGNVVRWFTAGLGLKHEKRLEGEAGALPPDGHGLTVLPFWAGERSPNWRGDARAVIAGLSLATQPAHLLRASMETISYQFVAVAEAMERVMSRPQVVIGTGGQLVHSPVWSQMLADALNLPVLISPEPEASSRGAALLALHGQGQMKRLWSLTPPRGRRHQPRERIHNIYRRARERQERLYKLLAPSWDEGAANDEPESGSRRTGLRSPAATR